MTADSSTLEVLARVIVPWAVILLVVLVAALWVRVAASDVLDELRANARPTTSLLDRLDTAPYAPWWRRRWVWGRPRPDRRSQRPQGPPVPLRRALLSVMRVR